MNIELDTSTVKSIIDDIIGCANMTVETIKDVIRNDEDTNAEDMDRLIQEIVNEKTTDVKVKFAILTGKFHEAKGKQLANIAEQDKEARQAQTVRHKEQLKNVSTNLKKEIAALKKRINELEKSRPLVPPSSSSSSSSSSSAVGRPRKIAKKTQATGNLISSRTRTRSNLEEEEEEEDGNASNDY